MCRRDDVRIQLSTQSCEPSDQMPLRTTVQGRLWFVEQDYQRKLAVIEGRKLDRETRPAGLCVTEPVEGHFCAGRVNGHP